MKYKPIAFAAAALAGGLAAAPASATLDLQTPLQQQGQGVGAVFTTLFLQGQGNNTTESGGVNFNGSVFRRRLGAIAIPHVHTRRHWDYLRQLSEPARTDCESC